jgi:hypothetical protein
MPKRLPKSKNTWVSLVRDFVKEWPEVLDGLHFTHMPVMYLKYVDILLKNNLTIHYDVTKEIKLKSQTKIANFLKFTIEQNYFKIKSVDLKFDVALLKKDIESKTSKILSKSFH